MGGSGEAQRACGYAGVSHREREAVALRQPIVSRTREYANAVTRPGEAMNAAISVILVNWNSGEFLRNCIAALDGAAAELGQPLQIICVDNASTDGSLDGLPGESPLVTLVRNGTNRGFAAACNAGAALATADYLLFLNPDTKVERNAIGAALGYLKSRESDGVGIVGIQLVDERGAVARSCAHFPTLGGYVWQIAGLTRFARFAHKGHVMQEWDHLCTRTVDHVTGAFLLMRRTLFETLGGFDESFFVYLEDVDLSLRAQQNGYQSVYYTGARAFHAGGGCSRGAKAKRISYSLESRLIYGAKHFGRRDAFCLSFITVFIEPIARVCFAIVSGSGSALRDTISAYRLLVSRIAQSYREPRANGRRLGRVHVDQ